MSYGIFYVLFGAETSDVGAREVSRGGVEDVVADAPEHQVLYVYRERFSGVRSTAGELICDNVRGHGV